MTLTKAWEEFLATFGVPAEMGEGEMHAVFFAGAAAAIALIHDNGLKPLALEVRDQSRVRQIPDDLGSMH